MNVRYLPLKVRRVGPHWKTIVSNERPETGQQQPHAGRRGIVQNAAKDVEVDARKGSASLVAPFACEGLQAVAQRQQFGQVVIVEAYSFGHPMPLRGGGCLRRGVKFPSFRKGDVGRGPLAG